MSIIKLNNRAVKDATAVGSITGLGNLILIKTQTASSSASISFVDGASSVVLDNTYKEYIFTFNNIHPASDANLTFNASADTGSNYNIAATTTLFEAYHNEADSSAALAYSTSNDHAQDTGFKKLAISIGNGNDECASGYLHLFEPSSTTFVKHYMGVIQNYQSDNYSQAEHFAGYYNTTSAIDAIQFKMSSGNIDAGTISLYGVV